MLFYVVLKWSLKVSHLTQQKPFVLNKIVVEVVVVLLDIFSGVLEKKKFSYRKHIYSGIWTSFLIC